VIGHDDVTGLREAVAVAHLAENRETLTMEENAMRLQKYYVEASFADRRCYISCPSSENELTTVRAAPWQGTVAITVVP